MKHASVVIVEVPEELASASQEMLNDLLRRGLRDLHIEQALTRYREGNISFAAAAELARISLSEFARAAHARGIQPPFDDEMLQEEIG